MLYRVSVLAALGTAFARDAGLEASTCSSDTCTPCEDRLDVTMGLTPADYGCLPGSLLYTGETQPGCWGGGSPFFYSGFAGFGCGCTEGSAVLTGETYFDYYYYTTFYQYTCCDTGYDETVGSGEQCGTFTGCTDPELCSSSLQLMEHDGVERQFTVLTPPGFSFGDDAYAVVVALHGWTQTGQWACQAMLQPYLKDMNVIGICPQATMGTEGGLYGWNNGAEGGATAYAPYVDSDDVGFIKAATAWAFEKYNVPSGLAFVTGFSCGGLMTFRLACEASDVYSGFSANSHAGPWAYGNGDPPMSYAYPTEDWALNCPEVAAPRPFRMAAGTDDEFFPDIDQSIFGYQSLAEYVYGCDMSDTTVTEYTDGDYHATCTEYHGCKEGAATKQCIYDEMPHVYASSTTSTLEVAATAYDSTPSAWKLWLDQYTFISCEYFFNQAPEVPLSPTCGKMQGDTLVCYPREDHHTDGCGAGSTPGLVAPYDYDGSFGEAYVKPCTNTGKKKYCKKKVNKGKCGNKKAAKKCKKQCGNCGETPPIALGRRK